MFDREQFIADCRAALSGDTPERQVREVVARAVSEPDAVLRELGEPKEAVIQKLYSAPELTILNVMVLVQIGSTDMRVPDAAYSFQARSTAFQTAGAIRP